MNEYELWNSNPIRRVASYLMRAGWARTEEKAIEYAAEIILNYENENQRYDLDEDHLTPEQRQKLDQLIKQSTL